MIDLELQVRIPTLCSMCMGIIESQEEGVYLSERELDRSFVSPNPMRLIGMHRSCAPDWVIALHDSRK